MTSSAFNYSADGTPSHSRLPRPGDDIQDQEQFLMQLRTAKRELEIAERQFNTVIDPLLVDHVIFRLGAAEKQFHFLLQTARRTGVVLEGVRWDRSFRS